MNVRFNVIGVPAPQGSKTRMPNGAMVEGSSATGRAKHRTWRQAVAHEAHQQRLLFACRGAFCGDVFWAVPHQKVARLRADQGSSRRAVAQPVLAEPAAIDIFHLKGRGAAQNGVERPF